MAEDNRIDSRSRCGEPANEVFIRVIAVGRLQSAVDYCDDQVVAFSELAHRGSRHLDRVRPTEAFVVLRLLPVGNCRRCESEKCHTYLADSPNYVRLKGFDA